MTPELEHKLLVRFPQIYKGYYKDKMETCMCWGFSCGDGWYPILYQLSLCIEDALNYSWKTKLKYKYAFLASRKWNNFVEKLVYWFIPKEVHKARRSSWMDLPEEDQKDKKKCDKAIKRMHAGERLTKIYRTKFFRWFPFLGYWHPDTGFEVVQVKEKYGTLRYYTGGTTPSREVDDQIQKFVDQAEYLSAITCEECGGQGTLRTQGWHRTLCFECAEPHQYTEEEMERWKEENPMEYIKYVSELEEK